MKTTDFAECLAVFLTMYLPGGKGLSENTIKSYRDTFKLILIFAEDYKRIPAERLTFAKFNADFVDDFLKWLETDRGNSASTRNQRLTAIRSFIRFVKRKKPEYLYQNQEILDIESKKAISSALAYLTPDCTQLVLAQPNQSSRFGRRDAVMLSLLYDSGARVQEICDLRVRDIRIQKPYTVTLNGKGHKTRSVPIMANTANALKKYLAENRLDTPEKLDYPLFFNHQRRSLTRAGVAYIFGKHSDAARQVNPAIPKHLSPHVFRHSKAMHMLQAGINLIYIRDFLGHVNLETTEIYAKADTEMKRVALESIHSPMNTNLPDWTSDKPLMSMLMQVCEPD